MLRLHMEATKRLEDLVAECKRLHDAGKKRAAKKVLAQADEVRARLKALEEGVKPKRPAPFNRR
jgi:hypothetical protein